MKNKNYDVVIVGSGAAGLSAAIYAGRYKLKTLVLEGKEFGGQTSTAGIIENYPGAKNIDGYALMKIMKEQAENVGVEFVSEEAVEIEKNNNCFFLKTNKETYHCVSVIIALGSSRRKLKVRGEEEFSSKGVHYCITCDGPLYTGKTIAVVGGGDAAIKGVSLAAEYADKIYVLVRDSKLRADPANKEKIEKLGEKIEIIYETEVKEIQGKNNVDSIVLSKEYKGSNLLAVDGLFIEIGSIPNTKSVESLKLNLDKDGHIEVDKNMETNVYGVYATGDITSFFEHFKQIITASAMGAVSASSAYGNYKKYVDTCDHSK